VYEWLEFYIEDGDTQMSEYKDNIQLAGNYIPVVPDCKVLQDLLY